MRVTTLPIHCERDTAVLSRGLLGTVAGGPLDPGNNEPNPETTSPPGRGRGQDSFQAEGSVSTASSEAMKLVSVSKSRSTGASFEADEPADSSL